MPAALTLRQAKAAHKARGGPAVSDKEIRQLQREIQLDQRAWAAKQREKTRTKAAQTRAEEQHRLKAEQAALQLGTQRRCDRFGHKSSQFHLGAFFTKASELIPMTETKGRSAETSFDDADDLDDESMLSALEDVDTTATTSVHEHRGDDCDAETVSKPESTIMPCLAPVVMNEHIDWDDFLESGTQITRELDNSKESAHPTASPQQQQSHRMSFDSSCSLGLTSQDIEALDPTPVVQITAGVKTDVATDRKLMPPPLMVPKKQFQAQGNDCSNRGMMKAKAHQRTEQAEFSLTQLENFLDDDMSLSQI